MVMSKEFRRAVSVQVYGYTDTIHGILSRLSQTTDRREDSDMTRIAGITAVAILLLSCGAQIPQPIPKAVALKELPKPDEVAFIELQAGADTAAIRIEDRQTIAAALGFLDYEVTGWHAPTERAISVDGVFAAFVRKSDLDPFAFFIDGDLIVVSGTTSGGEAYANSVTIGRFKAILGIAGKR
jgi:hypothetical protein